MPTQTIIGPDINKIQYYGEQGNKSIWDGYYKALAASDGVDTQLDLFTIPAGAKINRFTAVFTAHGDDGGDPTALPGLVTVGWRYKSGADGGTATAFLPSTDDSAAGSAANNLIPSKLTALGSSGNSTGVFDQDIVVYAVFSVVAVPLDYEIYAFAEGSFIGTR